MAPSRKIAELFVELRAASSALPNDLNRAEREFGRFTKFIEENPTAALAGLATAAGAAFIGIATKATLMASEVDTQMRRVVSALNLTSEQAKQSRADLAGVRGGVRAVASRDRARDEDGRRQRPGERRGPPGDDAGRVGSRGGHGR
jgi:hypothetical protein